MARYSVFAVSILVLSFPLVILSERANFASDGSLLINYFTVFYTISGIMNAIVLAMLIARLDSKLIGLRSWLILILYGYSGVQPLFAVFEQPAAVFQGIQTFVLIAVFLLKVYFFLIIFYALQTGRMLNYVVCFPIMKRLVDSIFENQYEIKEKRESTTSFRWFITNNDRQAYEADKSFGSREDCEKYIEKLRKVAEFKESYVRKNKFGTHWIEIIADGEVLCRSMDMRSSQEVEELIEDSVEKLPYCKFARA